MRMSAEPAGIFTIFSEMQISDDQKHAFQHDRTGCIAARTLMDRMGWKLGQHIAIAGDISPVNLELTLDGIFDTPDHYEMVVFIDGMFENSPAPTKSETERAFQLSFVSFLGNLKLFLMAICGAVTFTILLVSGNTLSMAVRERVREIGILKTLGFTPGIIVGIILGEAAVVAVGGGVLGCIGRRDVRHAPQRR